MYNKIDNKKAIASDSSVADLDLSHRKIVGNSLKEVYNIYVKEGKK